MQRTSTALALALWIGAASGHATEIRNGSFETGDFSQWIVSDVPQARFALAVGRADLGSSDFESFRSSPTHGEFAALHGFDGEGGEERAIRIAQDVAVGAGGTRVEFDYRAGWDLQSFCGGCRDRVFTVRIEPAGGGEALRTLPVLTLAAQAQDFDTGPRSGAIELGEFVGRTVRLSFEFAVPEPFTGPAFFQLDNVRVAPSAWVASGVVAGGAERLLRWEHLAGAQPGTAVGAGSGQLRSAAEPWLADSESRASLDLRRDLLSFRVRHLSLASGARVGTTGGVNTIRATLVCDADGSAGDSVLVDTAPVQLSENGTAAFFGNVQLPQACRDEPDIGFVLRP